MVVLSSYWEDISHRIETQNQLLGIADRLVSENVPKAAHACACTCYPAAWGISDHHPLVHTLTHGCAYQPSWLVSSVSWQYQACGPVLYAWKRRKGMRAT